MVGVDDGSIQKLEMRQMHLGFLSHKQTGQLCKVQRGIIPTNLQELVHVLLMSTSSKVHALYRAQLTYSVLSKGLSDILEGVTLKKVFFRLARVFRPS